MNTVEKHASVQNGYGVFVKTVLNHLIRARASVGQLMDTSTGEMMLEEDYVKKSKYRDIGAYSIKGKNHGR